MAQEFDLPIQLNKGLVPDPRVGRGYSREYLSEINRLTPKAFGLRPSTLQAPTISPSPTVSFPFPQLFPMHDQLMLLDETAVRILDDSGVTWTGSAETLYDFDTEASGASITAGICWDGVENGELGVFTNSASVVVMDRRGLLKGQANKTYVSSRNVNSICGHQGRVVYGGIAPADFWTDSWKAIFEEWLLASETGIDYDEADEIESNFVFWSGIRNGTDLWPLSSPERIDWRELFRSQQAGFAPTLTRGAVLRVLPIGRGLGIYTEDAVYAATPVASGAALTYGFRRILGHGVLGKGAVAGTASYDEHLFADVRGDLWRLSADFQLRKLGYRDFIGNFGDTAQISYDSLEDEFWIAGGIDADVGNGTNCYVLSQQGLGHSRQHPTSLYVLDSTLYGVVPTVGADAEYRAATEILDFGYRDLKLITTIEVGFSNPAGIETDAVEVALDYAYVSRDTFTRSAWVPVNRQGFARLQIAGLEFRVVVRWATGSETEPELDYINVKWQRHGLRSVRGLTGASEAV